nr:hypothetical protein [uncultured Roseateles sp.]
MNTTIIKTANFINLVSVIGLAYLHFTEPDVPKAGSFAHDVQCMQTAAAEAKEAGPDQVLWEQQAAACKRSVVDAQRRALAGA